MYIGNLWNERESSANIILRVFVFDLFNKFVSILLCQHAVTYLIPWQIKVRFEHWFISLQIYEICFDD